jgi:glycosyltransferase involved in cell wall biosynthesis
MDLKILYVIDSLGAGGAERSLVDMLPHLAHANVDPVIVCFYRRPQGFEQAVLEQGFRVHFLEGMALPRRLRQSRQVIAAENPHLIHTTLFESDVTGRLAAVGSSIPVLTSLVNTSYDPVRLRDPNIKAWKLWGVQTIDAWTARHFTHSFHAISHTVKEAAVTSLGITPERIAVIERGRDAGQYGQRTLERRRAARRSLGIDDEAEVIVNVARQEYQKGQRYLLEAMADLRQRRPRLTLLIAGRSGNASASLQQIVDERNLGEQVRFLGHRQDIPEILAAADLFVFPSLYEGLGGALIEAMAAGLPIVATDLPVLREVVESGGNARLIPPASPQGLADAIDDLADAVSRSFSSDSR